MLALRTTFLLCLLPVILGILIPLSPGLDSIGLCLSPPSLGLGHSYPNGPAQQRCPSACTGYYCLGIVRPLFCALVSDSNLEESCEPS